MCFSAEASFGAGAVLTGIGAATIKESKTTRQWPFALIPLLFALQQFAEGTLWLLLPDHRELIWAKIAAYFFLVFAFIVWPSWLPFSLTLLEKIKKRKTILQVLTGAALVFSGYIVYSFISYDMRAYVHNGHLRYDIAYPFKYHWLQTLPYLILTIVPLFLSSANRVWVFGAAIAAAYMVTFNFYAYYLVSVWCFFAAILSILILGILKSANSDDRFTNPG